MEKRLIYVTLENGSEEDVYILPTWNEEDIKRHLHMKYGDQKWLAWSDHKMNKEII
jgi:hypothetical protein